MTTKRVSRSGSSTKAMKKSAPRKMAAGKGPAGHIMPAPKGKRTLTHRQIEQAVKRVFERRAPADA